MTEETRTFELYPEIEMQEVRFKNRYGIQVAGHLYLPVSALSKWRELPAVVVASPFGAVKEQSAGMYAQEFAKWGFVSIAFDPSFTGESGGEARDVASPDVFTEDFSAAVDFLGTLPYVNRERIGVWAVCGLSGMALTAATNDVRIKVIGTISMYDMSRGISKGFHDYYTPENKEKIKQYFADQRWQDVITNTAGKGSHEINFDENGEVHSTKILPDEWPETPDPVIEDYLNYYKTKRGYHSRSVNSNSNWTALTPQAFFNFPLMSNIEEISPRPVLIVTGEHAISRYHAENTYERLNEPKELIVVPGAWHCDLYDKKDMIPLDRIQIFFENNL